MRTTALAVQPGARSARWKALWLLLGLAAAAPAATRPKLVILIVAEQFRPDYLDRYRPSFAAGGFNRLLKEGAVFRQCRYEYVATFPASGAAVLATGAYPDRTGIVAEYWYDRKNRRVVSAVEDPEQALVGSEQPRRPAASPFRLVGTTLADQLRLATRGRSRAVSLSLRDQTAVLLGGRRPAGCYWVDEAGRFVTSTYYSDTLPAWVSSFQQEHPPLRFRGRAWKAIDASETAPPLRVIDGQGPEALADFFAAWLASPLAMEQQFDFARAAIEGESLGGGAGGDLLILSVSSLYFLGLEVGADSPLLRDLVLRLDRKLEDFFAWLDARLGLPNVWIGFTATQGLSEVPEALPAEGLPGGRVAGEQIAAAVNARLSAVFGRDRYVEKYLFPSLYLNRRVVSDLASRYAGNGRGMGGAGALAAEVARLAGEAALEVPGVAGYLVPNGAAAFLSPESAPLMARSLYPERSGDLLIAYQPYYSELYGDGRGVSPGSFYSYDTHVPLLLYGAPFRAQTFDRAVSPTDLAPTLAAALEAPPPSSSTGRPLVEALKDR